MTISSMIETERTSPLDVGQPRCPVDHRSLSQQKTARVVEPVDRPIECDSAGVWHVRGYHEARTILRGSATKQAGFNAELIERIPGAMRPPILYQEGNDHHTQRKQTARFFTPKAVSADYGALMEALSDRIIVVLQRKGRADLSTLSMKLAVRVAGKVVGLTDSLLPGLDRRINAFFTNDATTLRRSPRALLGLLKTQTRVAHFFYVDVRPAIHARRRTPRQDVISHLLEQGYGEREILTECITYAAAGMVTTREFISIASWHLLEQPGLRARFLAAADEERLAILQEILRIEPIIGHLYRRATAPIELQSNGAPLTIPEGALIDLHVYAANADEGVVGEYPLALCPGRELHAERVLPTVISFGDGHHRCPGAYIALQETDIFLRRLLALDSLRIERKPSVRWNDLVAGYELRDFVIAVD